MDVQLRALVVTDVNIASATALAEYFVKQPPQLDVIFVIGPFANEKCTLRESVATAEGDMASIIAQFENIVCRVVYLASEFDPPCSLSEQMHLTPNSVNIYARQLQLNNDIFVTGLTEIGQSCADRVPESVDRSPESDDELDCVEVHGSTAISIIEELCDGISSSISERKKKTQTPTSCDFGIFLFKYKFAHTFNHFLFHMSAPLKKAAIKLCVIPSLSEVVTVPKYLDGLHIVCVDSLQKSLKFVVLHMTKSISSDENWLIDAIKHCQLVNGEIITK